MDASLNKAWKGWKKAQNNLRDMRFEYIYFYKEYAKSMEYGYSLLHAYFENALKDSNIKKTNPC